MRSVQLIVGEEAFQILGSEWDELVDRSVTNTPFQRLAYQRNWWRRIGPGSLNTIVVKADDGSLVAVGCFYLDQGTLYFNGCVEETDYLDLITPSDWAYAGWESVLTCFHSDGFPAWQKLDLCNIPELSPTREILPDLAKRWELQLTTEIQDVCPVITLPETFDLYLSSLDKKQRHEVRRKLRRAEAAGLSITQVGPGDDLTAAVDDFLVLLEKSSPEKDAWLNVRRRLLFHDLAKDAHEDGTLQLVFATVNGDKAAVLFNFDYEGSIWVYNSGLDPDHYGQLSPGIVLTARTIEKAVLNGKTRFDFLRGDEKYKYHFGASDTTVHRITLSRPLN